MTLNSPMTQIYMNTNQIDTKFCINNFYSFLCPDIKDIVYECRIGFTNNKGIMVHKKHFPIKDKNSLFLSVRNLFKESNIESQLGLMMANIYPIGNEEIKNDIFNKMGKTTSFFFNFYEGLQFDSLSVIHPQSIIDGKKYNGPPWRSNQIIDTNSLKELRILQANQSDEDQIITFSIFDAETNGVLSTKTKKINSYGVDIVIFDRSEITRGSKFIGLVLDKLPVGNGKPLIMRVFKNGEFNVSHG